MDTGETASDTGTSQQELLSGYNNAVRNSETIISNEEINQAAENTSMNKSKFQIISDAVYIKHFFPCNFFHCFPEAHPQVPLEFSSNMIGQKSAIHLCIHILELLM